MFCRRGLLGGVLRLPLISFEGGGRDCRDDLRKCGNWVSAVWGRSSEGIEEGSWGARG